MDQAPGGIERREGPRRLSDVRPPAVLLFVLGGFAYALAHGVATAESGTGAGRLAFAYGVYAAFALIAAGLGVFLARGPRGTLARLRRPKVVRDVARAIENDEFELYYQPQLSVASGLPCAAEALLRWNDGDTVRGPGSFLPEVEASEAIGPLTDHVLMLAIRQAGEWHRAGRPISVSVNLSVANLRDEGLTGRVDALLRRFEVPPELITLEVTETAVLSEPEQTRAVLDALVELGVSVSVDDFGTGYSSLLWLRLFPVSEVKIDQTFVKGLETDGEAYVSGVIRLAHDLGLTVVAEGVEDPPALAVLQRLGCDIAQGYLFARPLQRPALEEWFDTHLDDRWAPPLHELALDADYDALDPVRDMVTTVATELGYDEPALFDLNVAVTEAVANAIEHGPRRPDGKIRVRLTPDEGELRIDISGGGRTEAPAGHTGDIRRGRGFAIMSALMDEVGLRREEDDSLIRLARRHGGGDAASA